MATASAAGGRSDRARTQRGSTSGVVLVLAALVAAALSIWLVGQRGGRGGEPPAPPARGDARDRGPGISLPPPVAGAAGGGHAAAAPGAAGGAEAPPAYDPVEGARQLREAVLAADGDVDSTTEVLDADRLIARALLAHPELAAALAEVFPELDNRELAFRIALTLGRYRLDPAVYDALLEALEEGPALAREVAAYSLYGVRGDPRIAEAFAAGFTGDRGPAPTEDVRSAHAWALARMLPDLPPERRDVVRQTARDVLERGVGSPAFRAEAVPLLDVHGSPADRQQARGLLTGARERELAFAAARVLLDASEDEATVWAALERFADASSGDLTAQSLRAFLDEQAARIRRP